MRKILFRGYSKIFRKWYFGSYLYLDKPVHNPNSQDPVSTDPIHYIVTPDGEQHTVDPETVGQYTGHTDMKRKKIFAGDIVQRYKTEFNPPRKYKNPYVVHIKDEFPRAVEEYYSAFEHFTERVGYEVVGNIHDNPDLLTKNSAIDSPSDNP